MGEQRDQLHKFDQMIAEHAATLWTVCAGLVSPTLTVDAWTRTIATASVLYGSETHKSFPDDLTWLLNVTRFECAELRRLHANVTLNQGLNWALAQLSSGQREVVVLHDLADLDPTQVASVLQLSLDAASELHEQATAALARILSSQAA